MIWPEIGNRCDLNKEISQNTRHTTRAYGRIFGTHEERLQMLFVVIKRAYDSIGREHLWITLSGLGASDKLVKLIETYRVVRENSTKF